MFVPCLFWPSCLYSCLLGFFVFVFVFVLLELSDPSSWPGVCQVIGLLSLLILQTLHESLTLIEVTGVFEGLIFIWLVCSCSTV